MTSSHWMWDWVPDRSPGTVLLTQRCLFLIWVAVVGWGCCDHAVQAIVKVLVDKQAGIHWFFKIPFYLHKTLKTFSWYWKPGSCINTECFSRYEFIHSHFLSNQNENWRTQRHHWLLQQIEDELQTSSKDEGVVPDHTATIPKRRKYKSPSTWHHSEITTSQRNAE